MADRRLLGVVLLLGCAVRFATVARPNDQRSLAPWREADYVAIARSFDREGLDLFHPRVDWREDTPGYAEMELPLLPWSGALLYRIFGPHVQILRLLSALASAASLLVFARLAYRVVPAPGALLASAAFAANPLLVTFAGAMQPDELMVLFTVLSMDALWRWLEGGRGVALLAASGFAAAAVLAKAIAAYLGFVFGYLVLRKRGARALTDPQIWLAAALALLPGVAWYAWAYHFYAWTGLSLGVSNETHAISWVLLRHPRRAVMGNLTVEARDVFVWAGIPLAACAFLLDWRRIEPAVAWLAAIAVTYLLALDTSGDFWSFYYHSISVPPACLLAGFGLAGLYERAARAHVQRASLLRAAGVGLGVLLIATSSYRTLRLARDRDTLPNDFYRCARELAPAVPSDGRIVVRGGSETDEHGHPVAWNESMAFAWMDRKGFNYPSEKLSIETLDAIAARGGRFWLSEPTELDDPALRAQAEQRYRLLARCDGYALYDLAPR